MITRLVFFSYLCIVPAMTFFAQTNMHFNNSDLTKVFAGNYIRDDYPMQTDYGTPEDLVAWIHASITADSLKSYLVQMQQFETRNSGSDTLSATRGIGAARNWMLAQFQRFSNTSGNRILTGFFEFDLDICGVIHHKNVIAMLPGSQPEAGIIIIEAHLDSRCSVLCDINCLAQGMEDNGSGVALVLELARVLSKYNYRNTLVFMGTIGEEQGLDGAGALAEYAVQQDVHIKLVQNNDIVGGIICGETSSPPSCPGEGHIDSTQVRLFSNSWFNSPHKSVCRFIKLQYQEMLEPLVTVPMKITIMTAEDRTGRGGDHIPFRERGFPAMRFTSANEHGDAGVDVNYHDRQHTSDDILGLDLNSDGELDSFFVDFNYLARNAEINAVGAAMAAIGPEAPMITASYFDASTFYIEVDSTVHFPEYRIGLRTNQNDFDTIYTITDEYAGFFQTMNPEFVIYLSVMGVDSQSIESLPSEEVREQVSGTNDVEGQQPKNVYLHQNKPNPFDESTTISYWVKTAFQYDHAEIVIMDLNGKVIRRLGTSPQQGMNEVLYHHGYRATGTYVYALVVDGRVVEERTMVFAN
ncbi:MAG TPA: M28 family peptidase [Saprospiraceae bacterium]|nr:M28 family peptidase [Saprospiraceae bacterium]